MVSLHPSSLADTEPGVSQKFYQICAALTDCAIGVANLPNERGKLLAGLSPHRFLLRRDLADGVRWIACDDSVLDFRFERYAEEYRPCC